MPRQAEPTAAAPPPPEHTLARVHALFALVGLADAAIVPFFPLLLRERGFDVAQIGLLLGAMAATAFAAGPLWGYLADVRAGRELALATSIAGAAGTSLLVFAAHDRIALAAASVALWSCRSQHASLADAIALDRLGGLRRGEYGRVRLWTSIGWALAVLAWGIVVAATSYGTAALVYACALVGPGVWTLVGVGRVPVERRRVERRRPRLSRAGLARARPLLAFLLAVLLAQVAFVAGFNFSSLRIAGLGGGALLVAVAASLQAAAEVPVMASMTRLRRVVPARYFYVLGCAVYALVLVFWGVVTDPASVAAARLVLGVGFALTYVGSVIVVDELVPEHLRATGQVAAKSVAAGLAPIAGALGGGVVYGEVGPRAMFVGGAVFAAAAAAVTLRAEARGRLRPRLAGRRRGRAPSGAPPTARR